MCESEVVAKRRCIIPDIATLIKKGIKIPYPKRVTWT